MKYKIILPDAVYFAKHNKKLTVAYCYKCCMVFVSVLGTLVSLAKMAEPIEMPSGCPDTSDFGS